MHRLVQLPTRQVPLRRRYVPEADIGALRLGEQTPAVSRSNEIREVARQREYAIHVGLEAAGAFRLPHVPELDDIGASSALHVPVAAVVGRIVKLVVLEEVTRAAAVRRLQQT